MKLTPPPPHANRTDSSTKPRIETPNLRLAHLLPQPHQPISTDLRRQRKAEGVELILRRAEFLPAPDRALLRATFQAGQTAVHLSKILHQTPRAVRRQIRVLIRRVLAPEFLHVVTRSERWKDPRRHIARACFIEGRSIRATAKELGLSVHVVRRYSESIRIAATDPAAPDTEWAASLPPQRTGA